MSHEWSVLAESRARRAEIKRVREELRSVDSTNEGQLRQIQTLHAAIEQQDREIEHLRWTVDTLLLALDQAGVIDARAIGKQWHDRCLQQDEAVQSKSHQSTTLCGSCGVKIRVSESYLSDRGEVCTSCFDALQNPDEVDLF